LPLPRPLRARHLDGPDRLADARRHPADRDRAHRRVPGAHLRRGQAAAALHRARRAERAGRRAERAGRRARRAVRRAQARRAQAQRPASADMRVAVVGAGVTGLVAAHRLGQAGHTCDVYERWPGLGGQAATIDVGDGVLLERYYHHWFTSDHYIVELCEQLGVEVEWLRSSMAFFVGGRMHPFPSPLDRLRFEPLSLRSRLRTGLAVVALQRRRRELSFYEQETARAWIERAMGRPAWTQAWGPARRGK